MDPGANLPQFPPDETALSPGPLIFYSPFDAATEHVSNTLISQIPPRPLLWDVAVRRFSSPSVNANRQRLSGHIDAARTAYAKAFVAMQKSITDIDAATILSRSSETDVARTALDLLSQPSSTNEDKGRVSKFIDVLHHYHGVFDVLSQAGDFAYLAVVWETEGLTTDNDQMAKNKKELLGKITDMLVEIGLTLSRIEIYAKLFPTARMVELISMIYAAVADFLQEVVLHFNQKSSVRRALSSFIRPFDEKFGRAMDRIHRLETCIEKDAILLHAMQTASIAQHQLDSFLSRQHFTTTLDSFPLPATYHSSSRPPTPSPPPPGRNGSPSSSATSSSASPQNATRLSQGLCDAPDYQHALQWAAQQRRLTPHIPAAYLIWAQGMSVHTAIASLIFQVLQHRPGAVAEYGLDMDMFARAATSVRTLWDVWVYLVKKLGGCLVYISIGSAGEDEFAVVGKFVKTVRAWQGPPHLWVTIVHPYNEGFAGIEEATDLDGLYDNQRQAGTTVMKLMNERFGVDGIWKNCMSWDELLMVRGIELAILAGFEDTIKALSEPKEVELGGQ
ncbi:hypothetical protein N0V88_007489 [Collariella sp. IMI 366227]|nr:hypothetical protein N0V88_007489 [Collariella sp. IMI 366227]